MYSSPTIGLHRFHRIREFCEGSTENATLFYEIVQGLANSLPTTKIDMLVSRVIERAGLDGNEAAIEVRAAALAMGIELVESITSHGAREYKYGTMADHNLTEGGIRGGVASFLIDNALGVKHVERVVKPVLTKPEYDEDPIRCYVVDTTGTTVQRRLVRSAIKTSTVPLSYHCRAVTDAEATSKYGQAHALRESWLVDLDNAPMNARVLPEDLSARPAVAHMFVGDKMDARFAMQAAEIGLLEGFGVVVQAKEPSSSSLLDAPPCNLKVVNTPGAKNKWMEDNGEISVDRSVSIPAYVGNNELIGLSILRERARRFYPELKSEALEDIDKVSEDALTQDYPKIAFARHGKVALDGVWAGKVGNATGADVGLRENLCHVEGGNVLTGTLSNGTPYAIVGRDSVAVSKALLERDTGRNLSDQEVLAAIAKDLGIAVTNCHPVEQPGDFHIDMTMFLAAPGHVVLNDAMQAAHLLAAWLREDHQKMKPQISSEQAPTTGNRQDELATKRAELDAAFNHSGVFDLGKIARLEKSIAQLSRVASPMELELAAKKAELAELRSGKNGFDLGAIARVDAEIQELTVQIGTPREVLIGKKKLELLDLKNTQGTLNHVAIAELEWEIEALSVATSPVEKIDTATAEWEARGRNLEKKIFELFKHALEMAAYETKTAQDLETAGLTVHRVAGRFPNIYDMDHDVMNFLNGEGGTSPKGHTFFITQGGDRRAEEYIATKLTQEFPSGIEHLYFLDRALTKSTLRLNGAFNCRVKWEGSAPRFNAT